MDNFEKLHILLPKTLKCKILPKYDESRKFLHNEIFAYDENDIKYAVTRDLSGNLHMEEQITEEQLENDASKLKRTITLTPFKNDKKRGYSNISLKYGDDSYSILNNNGQIEINYNEDCFIVSDLNKKQKYLNILKKPFDISILGQMAMDNLQCDFHEM